MCVCALRSIFAASSINFYYTPECINIGEQFRVNFCAQRTKKKQKQRLKKKRKNNNKIPIQVHYINIVKWVLCAL